MFVLSFDLVRWCTFHRSRAPRSFPFSNVLSRGRSTALEVAAGNRHESQPLLSLLLSSFIISNRETFASIFQQSRVLPFPSAKRAQEEEGGLFIRDARIPRARKRDVAARVFNERSLARVDRSAESVCTCVHTCFLAAGYRYLQRRRGLLSTAIVHTASLSLSLSHLLSALHLSRLVHSAARSISICRFDRTKRKVNGVFPATNERSLDKPVVPIAPAISASEREKCRSRTGVTAKQPSMRIQNQCRERSPFRRWQSVPEPKSIGKDRPVAAFYVTLDRDRARVRVASQVEHCKSRRDAWTQSLSNVVDVARVSFVLLFEICLDTHAAPIGFSRFSRRNTVRRSFPFRLLQQSNRVTMKLDVSYTDHSHIIGKGGLTIKRVMEDTGCHIHFPDSNRSNHQEKSNQVSIAGEMEGVERARARVRVSQQIRRRF